MIECNEINEVYNQLRVAFSSEGTPSNEDLTLMLQLMMAAKDCTGDNGEYNYLVAKQYIGPTEVKIPINTMHSCSIAVLEGAMMYCGIKMFKGTTKNIEFTSMNTNDLRFEVLKGGKVLFEYLTLDNVELDD